MDIVKFQVSQNKKKMSDDWKGIQEELSQKNFELVKAREKGSPGPELQAINSEISRLETEKEQYEYK